MNRGKLENTITTQKCDSGDNMIIHDSDVHIDKSVNILITGLNEEEIKSIKTRIDSRDNERRINIEADNEILRKDNTRLKEIVIDLQRQLIAFLSLKF